MYVYLWGLGERIANDISMNVEDIERSIDQQQGIVREQVFSPMIDCIRNVVE